MKLWVVFGLGAGYGLAMRLLFGLALFNGAGAPGSAGPMMASFVVLVTTMPPR